MYPYGTARMFGGMFGIRAGFLSCVGWGFDSIFEFVARLFIDAIYFVFNLWCVIEHLIVFMVAPIGKSEHLLMFDCVVWNMLKKQSQSIGRTHRCCFKPFLIYNDTFEHFQFVVRYRASDCIYGCADRQERTSIDVRLCSVEHA